ncbi:hypothetical protein T440DRAFT_518914 [Plenodomus tracheiphilus IPT5]|uniref:Uncharacterized protein n=1 Tax=Plenodomus tracheiphilus IPT5 TaxID=1408161 RepID=A0A6A7B2F9_9PLEO|nr:hypothetical protein T440DRAFT_518914 [Plenodomus tracheiphilus IPT5]
MSRAEGYTRRQQRPNGGVGDHVWLLKHGELRAEGRNKIESTKKKAKLTSSELRKKKKDRMARRKRGEEVFSDEDE